MATIFWAGDSTVQYNDILTFPQTGIGQVMNLFLKPEVRVENHAKNGRSTKSFIDESRLTPIYDKITAGDFLFIQFGHNDEKKNDPQRYTDPYSDYMVNLEKFVNAARNKGAWPVFITPLERRCFIDEEHLDIGEHTDYVAAMKQTAENLNVPLIDLYSMSRAEMRKAGAEKNQRMVYASAGRCLSVPYGRADRQYASEIYGCSCLRGMYSERFKRTWRYL